MDLNNLAYFVKKKKKKVCCIMKKSAMQGVLTICCTLQSSNCTDTAKFHSIPSLIVKVERCKNMSTSALLLLL